MSMYKIIIGCLIVGLTLIMTTFIKLKGKHNFLGYRIPKVNLLKEKMKNSKIILIFSSDAIKSNVKLLDKLTLILQCKQSEKLYKYVVGTNAHSKEVKRVVPRDVLKSVTLTRMIITMCTLALCIGIKIGFNNMIVQQTLDINTIYQQANYKISKSDITSILTYIGNDYKLFIEEGNIEGLNKRIELYSENSFLDIDQIGITMICSEYTQAYEEGRISLNEYIAIAILAFFSNILVILYINVIYRIYKIKLLKEFNLVELIAILHMNRDGLNVYEILLEVNKYTVYLNPYIRRCLNKFINDPNGALDKLIKEVNDENFSNFVSILKSCLDNSKSINTEVLKIQRKLRLLNKKIDNDKTLEFKELYLTVAQFPLIAIFTLNLIMPFVEKVNVGGGITF